MDNIIALNLLGDRTCDNCGFTCKSINIVRCIRGEIASFCPEEFTCENWKEQQTKNPIIRHIFTKGEKNDK